MTLISDFSYFECIQQYLDLVKARPEMYCQNLSNLESIFQGHAYAFIQLGGLKKPIEDFNSQFCQWLIRHQGISAASGWAYEIDNLAVSKGVNPFDLFFELVEEFTSTWRE